MKQERVDKEILSEAKMMPLKFDFMIAMLGSDQPSRYNKKIQTIFWKTATTNYFSFSIALVNCNHLEELLDAI